MMMMQTHFSHNVFNKAIKLKGMTQVFIKKKKKKTKILHFMKLSTNNLVGI